MMKNFSFGIPIFTSFVTGQFLVGLSKFEGSYFHGHSLKLNSPPTDPVILLIDSIIILIVRSAALAQMVYLWFIGTEVPYPARSKISRGNYKPGV